MNPFEGSQLYETWKRDIYMPCESDKIKWQMKCKKVNMYMIRTIYLPSRYCHPPVLRYHHNPPALIPEPPGFCRGRLWLIGRCVTSLATICTQRWKHLACIKVNQLRFSSIPTDAGYTYWRTFLLWRYSLIVLRELHCPILSYEVPNWVSSYNSLKER